MVAAGCCWCGSLSGRECVCEWAGIEGSTPRARVRVRAARRKAGRALAGVQHIAGQGRQAGQLASRTGLRAKKSNLRAGSGSCRGRGRGRGGLSRVLEEGQSSQQHSAAPPTPPPSPSRLLTTLPTSWDRRLPVREASAKASASVKFACVKRL